MEIKTVGIDLAKNVFQIHGMNERGKPILRKQLKRDQVVVFFASLPPCLIGMEACSSAHYWARKLEELGHTVRLMALQFVKPYVKSNKNDAADAEAICEAVTRPTMRFVPIKNVEQQSVLALHRARQGFVKARTAQANPSSDGYCYVNAGKVRARGFEAEISGEVIERLQLPTGYTYTQTKTLDDIDASLNGAALNGNNLFDKRYYATIGTETFGNYYGDPRNFMVSVKANF
jgi:hypothetical protein